MVVELSRAMSPVTVTPRIGASSEGTASGSWKGASAVKTAERGVGFQIVFLSRPPARIVGSANLGYCEVVAPVEKVDVIPAWRTPCPRPLIFTKAMRSAEASSFRGGLAEARIGRNGPTGGVASLGSVDILPPPYRSQSKVAAKASIPMKLTAFFS